MEYLQLSMDDYIQSKNDIKENLGTIVKSFVRIGWQLSRIDKSGAYKNDGYKTIAEFAKAEYGMSATGTSRFIRVYEKYSVPGDTPELRDEYKDYNRSQLEEMLQIPEEDHEMIRPEAHREDIRELKGWNGKKQYIQLASGISYKAPTGEIINCEHDAIGNMAIAFVGSSGVQMGWLASQADMLAEDWKFTEG